MTAPGLAQVGCGHWGRNLARNFADLGALAAVADADDAIAARIGAEHGVPARGFEEVLADPSIAAVSLATPAPLHAPMALAAFAAGKHVYVEKPLALDPADGARLIEAANRAGRILMVGHLLQYHPIFLALKALVAAGELGTLRYVYSNRLGLGKYRVEENVLWSFAPHDISMLLALAGEEPDRVAADGAAYVTPGIADWCVCRLGFPSGLRGHVCASWSHPFKEHRLVAVGDRAMAAFEDSQPDWDKRLALYRHGIERAGPAPVPVRADPVYVPVARAEPLRRECEHFLACVRDGARPRTDGAEGLAVLRVLDRAERALAASLED